MTEFNKSDFYLGAFVICAGLLMGKLVTTMVNGGEKSETMYISVPANYTVKQVPLVHVTYKERGVLMHSLYFDDGNLVANVENFDNLNEAMDTMAGILKG